MVDESGKATGGVFRWKTRDLIHFEEVGLVDSADAASCAASASLPVRPEIAEAAIRYWSPHPTGKRVLPLRNHADGAPYFQMSAEEDLPEDQRKVRIRVNTHFHG